MLLLRCFVVLGSLCGLHGRTVELNWTVNGVEGYDLRYHTPYNVNLVHVVNSQPERAVRPPPQLKVTVHSL